MGVLDDAIKEHLELKRKHGVPEEELQRQEEEALGPARRDVAQQLEDDAELEPGQPVPAETEAGEALVAAEPEEPAAVEETAVVEDTQVPERGPSVVEQDTALFDMEQDATEERPVSPAPLEASIPEETAVHEPVEPTPVEPPPVEPPPVAEEPSVVEEPVGEPGHEPDPDDRLGETQPHGFDAVEDELGEEDEPLEPAEDEDDILASDPEDDELDVLEDTPDFLQETPEHDRLWFEQKPPRDFDFD